MGRIEREDVRSYGLLGENFKSFWFNFYVRL